MKLRVIISLILLFTGFALAQEYKPYNTFDKETELQKFVEQGGKVEEMSPDVYRLINRIGESRTFYLRSKEDVNGNNEPVDTTIINIWEIDTTKYNGMFTFWQQLEVANSLWGPLPIEDLNNNGQPELYGYTDAIVPNLVGPVRIYEQGTNGFFQEVFKYDSATIFVKGIGDINGSGNKGIILDATDFGGADVDFYPVYRSDSVDSLPTTFDYYFYLDTLQINEMVFGDWDNNGIPDCAYTTSDIWDTTMIAIAEYRDSINNFEELFQFSSIFESVFSGFAIDDFDEDGKTEFVVSSGPGNIFVIENKDENEYSIVDQFPFPIPNTYMQASTNDIDGNGKPEFWIGGQDFENGITVYQCYEADGDNSYKSVARIELRYSTSFAANYIQAIDIDNDGKEELIISSGNIILILKFAGSPGNHKYKLWYAKLGEATQPGVEFDPVAIEDFNGDGKKDMIIPMEKYTPSIYYAFSYILRQDKPNWITETKNNEKTFEIINCYPNPFNLESTISFNIIESSNVQINIYNSLGKEIKSLLDKGLSPGNYTIPWDAKDKYGNSLTSGVYLIVLKTRNSIKTFKSILLK
jgi:FG-GAP-like repeat/FlgD Ig-like domain